METVKHIVFDLNEFLIEPNKILGGLYLSQNGGGNLLIKSMNDEEYLIRYFFSQISLVPSENDKPYYYKDMLLPNILVDHILDTHSSEQILNKILKTNLTKPVKAIAKMIFDPTMSCKYKLINQNNMKIIKELSKKYTVHLLGNYNSECLEYIVKSNKLNREINGSISSSGSLRAIKSSYQEDFTIYFEFITKHSLSPKECLFVDSNDYLKSLEAYSSFLGYPLKTISIDTFLKLCSSL